MTNESELPVGSIPELTADDDRFHAASDHWWETETAWFSFSIPERRIGGWFYNQVLATQRVCNGGAWVWDDSPAAALYEQNHKGLEIPDVAELDLRDVHLPNGNHIEVLEPLMSYRIRYQDPGRFEADLRFDGIMAPNSHPIGCAPFWRGRHFDQPMHVTGTIVLDGEELSVDSLSVRDRSWGPRPQGPDPRKPPRSADDAAARAAKPPRPREGVGYPFATADERNGWLVYTRPTIVDGVASDELSTGYLLRDGEYGHLVSGRRRIWLDPTSRWLARVEVEVVDEHGRELVAAGELVSHHGADPISSGTGLFRWEWDGLQGWGEDQTYAPQDILEALDRTPH
ncbi:MAG TPA: hypothetical protein VIR58_08660 [Acidimicrobiales bacterium]